MAILTINDSHRSAIAAATGARFDGGTLTVRSGAGPGAGNAATGVLLVTLAVSTPAFAAGAAGVAESNANWQGTAVVTGAPGHYRLINVGGQEIREGDAAESPGTGEVMLFTGLVGGDIVQGGVVTILAGDYVITQPAS